MCHSVTTANVFRITYGQIIRCYMWSRAVLNWLHVSRVAVNDTLKSLIGNLFSHLYLLSAHCRQILTSEKSRIFLFYKDFLSAVVLNPPCVPQNTIERFFSSIGKSSRVKRIYIYIYIYTYIYMCVCVCVCVCLCVCVYVCVCVKNYKKKYLKI